MKSPIDTEALNIQSMQPFLVPQTVQAVEAETYDFDITPTANRGGSVPIEGLMNIDLDLRTKDVTGRVFGAGPETFEGEFPVALVAGAIIVTALVAGGVYAAWQASKALEFAQFAMTPGIEIAESVAEAIAPAEE